MRRSFATGVGTGDDSSPTENDCPARGAGRDDSNPGTSGSSDSRRPIPDATLTLEPGWFSTSSGLLGELTETCVLKSRSPSCAASDRGSEGCAVLSLFPLRPLTHVAVDPSLELRGVWLDMFVRVVSVHDLILLGRYRRMSSRADGRQAMMMPVVISTLDQVASQVRSSAGIGDVLVHVGQPHRTMSRILPASDYLQVAEELA